MRKLIILDPGYDNITGHHHAYNVLLAQNAKDYGFEPYLFSYKSQAEVGIGKRTFRASLYGNPKTPSQTIMWIGKTNIIFREDLESNVTPYVDSESVILIHTCTFALTSGLIEWLEGLGKKGIFPEVRLCYHDVTTQFWIGDMEARKLCLNLAESSFKQIVSLKNKTYISSTTHSIANEFSKWSEKKIETVSVPRDFKSLTELNHKATKNKHITFLYIGPLRLDKGALELIENLKAITQALPDIRIHFCVPSAPDHIQDLITTASGNVSLSIGEANSEEQYFSEILKADYILCLYSLQQYQYRVSSITFDALAAGVPVLSTKGVGGHEALDKPTLTAIEFAPSLDEADIIKAFQSACANKAKRKKAALKCATSIRNMLKPELWLEKILF